MSSCIFDMIICHLCSNWRVGGWVRKNPNVVRIVKSAQINGRSLSTDLITFTSNDLPFVLSEWDMYAVNVLALSDQVRFWIEF